MISTHTDGSHGLDLEHLLQAASRASYGNKPILSDKSVSISERLVYFDAMVTSVACFAGGHRNIYKTRSRKLDIKFRKLVRARKVFFYPLASSEAMLPLRFVASQFIIRIMTLFLTRRSDIP